MAAKALRMRRARIDRVARWWCLAVSGTRQKIVILILLASMIAGVAGGAVFLTYKWLSQSTFFQVTGIKIEGCQRVSRSTVLALAGVDVQANLLALDLDAIKTRITSNPWIATARVERDWPSRLEIFIKERRPVFFLNTGSGLYYVDHKGKVFAAVGTEDDLDFPTLTGLEDINFKENNALLEKELSAALKFIYYAGHGSSFLLRQNISELHINKEGDFILFLADQPFPIYLGREVSRTKYYRLAKVLEWLYKNREFENVTYIRLDYKDKKILVGKKMPTDA